MITKTILSGVRAASLECRRNFGLMVPAMQKVSDPIQQLFLDKVREYKSKSKYVIALSYHCLHIHVATTCSMELIEKFRFSDFFSFFLFSRNDSFVDPTPEIQNEMKSELDRVAKVDNLHCSEQITSHYVITLHLYFILFQF